MDTSFRGTAFGVIHALPLVDEMSTAHSDLQDRAGRHLLGALETPRLRSGQARAVWSDRDTAQDALGDGDCEQSLQHVVIAPYSVDPL
jgi:hypothetical protein